MGRRTTSNPRDKICQIPLNSEEREMFRRFVSIRGGGSRAEALRELVREYVADHDNLTSESEA